MRLRSSYVGKDMWVRTVDMAAAHGVAVGCMEDGTIAQLNCLRDAEIPLVTLDAGPKHQSLLCSAIEAQQDADATRTHERTWSRTPYAYVEPDPTANMSLVKRTPSSST